MNKKRANAQTRYMRSQLFSLILLPLVSFSAFAAEVNVPLEFNHRVIRELLVSQIYTGNNETAPVFADRMRCNNLILSNPQIASRGDQLQITSAGRARIGAVVGNRCMEILKWQGLIEVYQKPYVEAKGSSVKFQVVGSNIYDRDGQKQAATGKLWDWLKGYVHPRFDDFEIDLKSVLHELGALLSTAFPGSDQKVTPRLVDSVSLAGVETVSSGVRASLRISLPRPRPRTAVKPEPVLTAEELKRWEVAWQQWDAFITYVIKSSANDAEGRAGRLALLEVLLAARYDLVDALAVARPGEPDIVRRLFLKTWERLAPLLRDLSSDLSGTSALRYLSFIAAADALQAADRLGAELGLEISADGLRRLARMIVPQPKQDPLKYSMEVDPELREIFGFGPPIPLSDERSALDILDWILFSAQAAEGPDRALVRRLNGWVPTRDKLNTYLPLVRDLLSQTTRGLLQKKSLDKRYHALFRSLLLATAWQETCWRQFIKKGKMIKPIQSGTGSVGIMQVNQNVWRGIYKLEGLRKDIAYNAQAGGEILVHYLVDYAIRKGEHTKTGNIDNLARAAYAVYNGGPSHLRRYRSAKTSQSLKKIDRSFWNKYQTIKQGDELAVVRCYGVTADSNKSNTAVYGMYSTRAQAEKAGTSLPKAIRQSKPWVRQLKDIQDAIRTIKGG